MSKKYAEIVGGAVRAFHTVADDFVPQASPDSGISFVDVTNISPEPEEGWTWNGSTFTDPGPAPEPTLTAEQEAAKFYADREAKLADTDYVEKVFADFNARSVAIPQKYIDLATYRQELRDLPEAGGFDAQVPASYTWPTDPRA